MYPARRPPRRRALLDRPGPRLFLGRGEERDEAEQAVSRPDELLEARALDPEHLQILPRLLFGKLRHLGLEPRRDPHRLSPLAGGELLDLRAAAVTVRDGLLVHVGHIEDRLGRDEAPENLGQRIRTVREAAGRGSSREVIPEPLQLRDFGLEPGVSALGRPANPLEAPLDRSEVSEQELGVYGLRVAHSIHAAVHVRDVLLLEAPARVRARRRAPGCPRETDSRAPRAGSPRVPGPAMSTKSTVAGTTFLLPMTSASAGRTPSGTIPPQPQVRVYRR